MNFKMSPEKVPGLCGSCLHCKMRVTHSNSLIVWCDDIDKWVTEQIDYCPDFREKTIFSEELPTWMQGQSWMPVEVKNGSTRWNKTFMGRDDDMFEKVEFSPFEQWGKLKINKKAGISKGGA